MLKWNYGNDIKLLGRKSVSVYCWKWARNDSLIESKKIQIRHNQCKLKRKPLCAILKEPCDLFCQVGVRMLETGVWGTFYNVTTNLADLQDKEFKTQVWTNHHSIIIFFTEILLLPYCYSTLTLYIVICAYHLQSWNYKYKDWGS